ncbi:hypothetical protein [Sphingobium yanoikuyae]|uniref:hypothetical protein n=1 Tax=Sphingobium yanoikuyae TaxID=13690 RepID=UPI00293C34CF|nr:hypothetical protein [Sphingobium yanoikuyae]MDV3480847.1 hypothetical protein [Sphingobium yanoikuyae]
MTDNTTSRVLTFDGIPLQAERVCDGPDSFDCMNAWDPGTNERLVEISWHRARVSWD